MSRILCNAQNTRRNTSNPGDLRNGCLTFWQLSAPTLIPGLVRVPAGREKPFADNTLARIAARAQRTRQECRQWEGSGRERLPLDGHNFASRAGDQVRNWDGEFMLRNKSASSRLVR